MVDLQAKAGTRFKVKYEFIKRPYTASTWIGITELVLPSVHPESKGTALKPL